MSKIKASFSLLFAIFLVGILSTAVFAHSTYTWSVGPSATTANTFDVSVTRLYSTETSFVVKTYAADATGAFTATGNSYTINVDATTGKGTITIPASDVQVGTEYRFDLYDSTGTTQLESKLGVITSPAPTSQASVTNNPSMIDLNGTGLPNSNHTGADAKKQPGQSTHGFYQNNTNSCASCHQAHTAANGESLLFKDGVYSTCTACHDGTTGGYNSFAPTSAATTKTIEGTFNISAGMNGSIHQADGSLKISAAPGGGGTTSSAYSTQDFDCASCHAPHGAGSNDENNLNTDPMGWGSVPYAATAGQKVTYFKGHGLTTITSTNDNKNGKLFFNIQIVDLNNGGTIPTTETTPYILVKTTATSDDITASPSTKSGNYFWTRAGVKAGDLVIQTYRWNNTKYVPDYSLWNRELGYPQVANTVLKQGSTDLTMNPQLHIVWRDAFAYGPAVALVDNANVSIGIDVETVKVNRQEDISALYDSSDPNYIPDSGTEMSKYCAACHVDYLSTTRTDNTGVYTIAHRHATAMDETTCVRCHYAHGSDATIMHDANDNTQYDLTTPVGQTSVLGKAGVGLTTQQALSYLLDPNPNSALKRYTGMSVCYACHGQGEQFIGNPNTNQPDKTTGQFLLGGQPGQYATRTPVSK
jgi:predicted CXXCH cytochrome family protein